MLIGCDEFYEPDTLHGISGCSSWLLRASLSEKKNHTRNSEIKSSCETLETPIEKKKPWAMVVKHEFEDIGFWVGE